MDRKIEFSADGIIVGKPGQLRIIGRCCEDPVRIGDAFESVYDYQYSVDSDGHELARRVNPVAVRLRIVGIEAYGRELESLGEGMTGALDLEGSGQELVHPGLVLSGELVVANGQSVPPQSKSSASS
jgi:hypothetical protein